jgi:hypothetical protein
MAKTKKKTNKKDAVVPEGTKELNDIVKKREQERDQEPKEEVNRLLFRHTLQVLCVIISFKKSNLYVFISILLPSGDISIGTSLPASLSLYTAQFTLLSVKQ